MMKFTRMYVMCATYITIASFYWKCSLFASQKNSFRFKQMMLDCHKGSKRRMCFQPHSSDHAYIYTFHGQVPVYSSLIASVKWCDHHWNRYRGSSLILVKIKPTSRKGNLNKPCHHHVIHWSVHIEQSTVTADCTFFLSFFWRPEWILSQVYKERWSCNAWYNSTCTMCKTMVIITLWLYCRNPQLMDISVLSRNRVTNQAAFVNMQMNLSPVLQTTQCQSSTQCPSVGEMMSCHIEVLIHFKPVNKALVLTIVLCIHTYPHMLIKMHRHFRQIFYEFCISASSESVLFLGVC